MFQRRRIVALFGLGIVGPCLLLGYLAFRGVQNDQALVEKQRLEDLRLAVDRVLHEVDTGLAAVEKTLSEALPGLGGFPSSRARAALDMLVARNPLAEQIFYLSPSGQARLPTAKLLYAGDGTRGDSGFAAAAPDPSGDYESGESLEFRAHDLPGALAAYQRAYRKSGDDRRAGMLLNAVARVQKKSGFLREAVATYETIVRDHGQATIAGGIPLGPAAMLEICALSRDLGEPEKSMRAAAALLRTLNESGGEIERAEFDLLSGRAKDIVGPMLANPPQGIDIGPIGSEFRALSEVASRRREQTERALAFEERAGPVLGSRLRAAVREMNVLRFSRSVLDIGERTYLVSLALSPAEAGPAGTGDGPAAWGFIVDAARLSEEFLRPAVLTQIPPERGSWIVRRADGSVLLSSDRPSSGAASLRAGFVGNVPNWVLEAYLPPSHPIRTVLATRRGFYSLVFLLIAGILVFGLVLTIRSVSHELELARMKSDFVSTVSHEFKSPLTSIRQLAEMLQSGRVPSEERRQKYYDVLLEQSERLALLTDNILGLAKIEEGRGKFVFEPTDLSTLLAEIVTSFQERVRHEGFSIKLDPQERLPMLHADRTALSQAVANLLDNAIKYSGDSREVSVRAFSEGPAVTIAVQDLGLGIHAEDHGRIFERFYRAGDELTRSVKGSGLGLTLVKEIVEAHGGTVRVDSEPGRGSTFSIRLPLARARKERP